DQESHVPERMPRGGVWLSTVPPRVDRRVGGDVCLAVELPEEEVLPFEFLEDGQTFREFQVPAAVVNRHGRPRIYNSLYGGCRPSKLQRMSDAHKRTGTWSGMLRSAHIKGLIPFLERHGLLASSTDRPAGGEGIY